MWAGVTYWNPLAQKQERVCVCVYSVFFVVCWTASWNDDGHPGQKGRGGNLGAGAAAAAAEQESMTLPCPGRAPPVSSSPQKKKHGMFQQRHGPPPGPVPRHVQIWYYYSFKNESSLYVSPLASACHSAARLLLQNAWNYVTRHVKSFEYKIHFNVLFHGLNGSVSREQEWQFWSKHGSEINILHRWIVGVLCHEVMSMDSKFQNKPCPRRPQSLCCWF